MGKICRLPTPVFNSYHFAEIKTGKLFGTRLLVCDWVLSFVDDGSDRRNVLAIATMTNFPNLQYNFTAVGMNEKKGNVVVVDFKQTG